MNKGESIRHWLLVAKAAGEVMEHCLQQVVRELGDGTVLVEVTEESTAPIRPALPKRDMVLP